MKYNPETNRFEYDFDDFKSKLSDKTKVVLFCNPNNPTGSVMSEAESLKFTEILQKYPNVIVIEDSAYCVYTSTKK
jgi:aspartate/methionine/tyrosine aminotransferase